MDPYIKNLTYVIQNTDMTTSYKMVWIRSIIEICKEKPNLNVISFDEISEKTFEIYWNQSFFFELIQGSNPNQKPVIYQIVSKEIEIYKKNFDHQPKFYSKVKDHVNVPVKKISNELKKYVSHLFQKVGNKKYEIYELDLVKRTVRPFHPGLIHDYFDLLSDVISYRWVRFLEDFNDSRRISKKMRGIDLQNVKRDTQLKKFWKYLDLENPHRICFHTNEPIVEGKISVDHVIPWSYLFSDDIWNLVYVDKNENSSKNNKIPNENTIKKLEKRNENLFKLMKEKFPNDKPTYQLGLSIKLKLVRKYWIKSK